MSCPHLVNFLPFSRDTGKAARDYRLCGAQIAGTRPRGSMVVNSETLRSGTKQHSLSHGSMKFICTIRQHSRGYWSWRYWCWELRMWSRVRQKRAPVGPNVVRSIYCHFCRRKIKGCRTWRLN